MEHKSGFKVLAFWRLGFGIWDLRFGIWDLGCMVYGLTPRARGLGFEVLISGMGLATIEGLWFGDYSACISVKGRELRTRVQAIGYMA
jgi:hypothetical protein